VSNAKDGSDASTTTFLITMHNKRGLG